MNGPVRSMQLLEAPVTLPWSAFERLLSEQLARIMRSTGELRHVSNGWQIGALCDLYVKAHITLHGAKRNGRTATEDWHALMDQAEAIARRDVFTPAREG